MSRIGAGTTERLQDAFMITMDAQTAARHEATIAEALRAADLPVVASPSRWRLRIPALVAAAMVVAPVGAAVAADNANPGDVLYPVKRIVEPIVSIFDSDVVASHRVEELAHIVDEPAEIDRIPSAVSDARDAISDLPPDHALRGEFDLITDRVPDHRIVDQPVTDVISDEVPPKDDVPGDDGSDVVTPPDERPTDRATTSTTEPEIVEHTTTTQGSAERPPPEDPPVTDTTLPHADGDGHPRHNVDTGTDQTRDQG
ncbi:MAG: hypothetical protein BMS9Abin20_0410 [Acidimicrobiia bacterium]|nr:MAG: hypothetical protein BMS9Abin20_0410 [Acidimicrobiia bacterium]